MQHATCNMQHATCINAPVWCAAVQQCNRAPLWTESVVHSVQYGAQLKFYITFYSWPDASTIYFRYLLVHSLYALWVRFLIPKESKWLLSQAKLGNLNYCLIFCETGSLNIRTKLEETLGSHSNYKNSIIITPGTMNLWFCNKEATLEREITTTAVVNLM